MIRNVLVMKSGLVLFSREFANTVQQVREGSPFVFATNMKIVAPHEDTEHRVCRAKLMEGRKEEAQRCSSGSSTHSDLPFLRETGLSHGGHGAAGRERMRSPSYSGVSHIIISGFLRFLRPQNSTTAA